MHFMDKPMSHSQEVEQKKKSTLRQVDASTGVSITVVSPWLYCGENITNARRNNIQNITAAIQSKHQHGNLTEKGSDEVRLHGLNMYFSGWNVSSSMRLGLHPQYWLNMSKIPVLRR